MVSEWRMRRGEEWKKNKIKREQNKEETRQEIREMEWRDVKRVEDGKGDAQ